MFLVNLCSYKTNVYKPFDQQKLVWTGYYQAVDSTDRPVSSATRAKGPQDPTYKTETVFGGDTYVGRYSFRTTSQDWGAVFLKDGSEKPIQSNLGDIFMASCYGAWRFSLFLLSIEQ